MKEETRIKKLEYKKEMDPFNKEAAERYKRRRTEMNISLQKLSEMTKISKSTLQRYENGSDIPLNKLIDIANALNCPPAYFMGWESKDLPLQYYKNIIDIVEECGFKLEYNSTEEIFTLKSDSADLVVSYEDIKRLKDDIKAYAKFKITELVIKHTHIEADDPLK